MRNYRFNFISLFGSFTQFFFDTFRGIEVSKFLRINLMTECVNVGLNTIYIVIIISTFTGAVSAIQTAYNLTSPWIADYFVALVVRDTMFSLIPTLMALVYAGKVGSQIASELGTMKITEQVDALEVLGINSKSYLVFPKVLASVIMFPLLVIVGCFMAMMGGFIASNALEIISSTDYIRGIRADFNPFIVTIIILKSLLFALMVPFISSFYGMTTYGGALEVAKSSTSSVTNCCIAILAGDYLLTQLLAN